MDIKEVGKKAKKAGNKLVENAPIVIICGVGVALLISAFSNNKSQSTTEETPSDGATSDEYTPVSGQGTYGTAWENADVIMSWLDKNFSSLEEEMDKNASIVNDKLNEVYDSINTPTGSGILEYVAEIEEMTPDQIKNADLNGDGKVDTKDAVIALKNQQNAANNLPVKGDNSDQEGS